MQTTDTAGSERSAWSSRRSTVRQKNSHEEIMELKVEKVAGSRLWVSCLVPSCPKYI